MRIGVLGLGAMGLPIAVRLSRGWDTRGFDTDGTRCALASAAGVTAAGTAEELAAGADVLLAVLSGAAAQRAAFDGADAAGPIAAMRRGAVLLELTSGDPKLSRELEAAAVRRGVGFVSAPMAGDPDAATGGRLGFFVSGRDESVKQVRPILQSLSRPAGIRVLGDDAGAGQTMKLVVNALWFAQAATVAEGMLLAARAGLDPETVSSVLAESAAASAFVRDYLPRVLDGDYVDSFGIDAITEELDTVVALARDLRTPSGVLESVRDLHVAAHDEFGVVPGELLVVRLLERRAGMLLRPNPRNGGA